MNTRSRHFGLGLCLASLSALLFLACAAAPTIAQERLVSAAAGHAWPATDALDPRLVRPEAGNGTDGIWSVPFDHPEPRTYHCAIYDPVRQRMVVFGGAARPLDLIWSLSLDEPVQWSHVSVSGPVPAMRLGATAIYDPVHDRVIMFGGAVADQSELNEVWALSLSGSRQWSRLEITGPAPIDRYLHTAIYDSARNRMIIYGGQHQGTFLGDVWALDLVGEPSWTELIPSTPIPQERRYHSAMYDPVRDRMIIFGGDALGSGQLNDTWELDLSATPTWQQIVSPEPERRTGHTLIYDPTGDRAVLLGGWGIPDGGHYYGVFYEIWVFPFGGGHWTKVPFFRYTGSNRAPAIYDAGRHRVVAYDGQNAMNIPAVSLTDPLSRTSLLPMPQFHTGQAAIYDPVRERMLMFGGRNQDDLERDTWELSLSGVVKWSRLAVQGFEERLGRENPTAVYDPLRDRMVIFGGTSDLSETWELRLAGTPTWHQLSPEGALPESREGHTAIYDPRRDRMIVFGGVGHVTSRDDAWALSLAGTPTWSPLPSGPKRSWHSAIYDPVGDRMLVLGGADNRYYQWTNEVWSLSLAEPMTWSLLTPTGNAPVPRYGSSAVYDPIRHRVVVFGGCCFTDEKGDDYSFGDTWELSLDGALQWRALASGFPGGRRNPSLIYDPVGDRAILYGGDGPKDVGFEDVWALTWGEPASPSVSCPTNVLPASPLRLDYVVANPLPTTRGVEWTLTSEHDWPGFPLHGFSLVGGGGADTVRLDLPIPPTSFEAPNTLSFASWLSGAQGNDQSCQHLIQDLETPVLVALISATAEPGRVLLRWNAGGVLGGLAHVQRRDAASAWRTLGSAIADGGDRLSYEDREVRPGGVYEYRLELRIDGRQTYSGEARVSVPGTLPLALERASRSPQGIEVVLSLPSTAPARLECFDLAGRRVLGRGLEGLGYGRHEMVLADGDPLAPGVYLLRLSQGTGRATLRFVVVR